MKKDYSVIIPVWNTPISYIENSIKSITNNSCNWEILLVDDGSLEETAQELKNISEKHEGVFLITSSHTGVSNARNLGVARARGRYVLFLDSDDEMMPKVLDTLLPILEQAKPDLLLGQIAREKSNTQDLDKTSSQSCIDLSNQKQILRNYYLTLQDKRFREKGKWLNRAPHGRIVRRELAQDVLMPEEIQFGEDVIWNFQLLNKAQKILFFPYQVYCYQENKFSATQQYRKNFPAELEKLLKKYRQEVSTWPKRDQKLLPVATMEYFTILMRLYVFSAEPKERNLHFQEIMEDPFWKQVLKEAKPADYHGRYRLVAILGKMNLKKLIYLTFSLYSHVR